MLPFPWLPGRANGLFPYNTPAWSLFMEYIINIVYALVLLRISKRWLLVLLALSAIWIAAVARYRGWIITGWDAPTFADGFPRVFFSFLAGLTVYRFNLAIRNRLNFLLLAILLIGVFMFPHRTNDWITEMILVMLAFPLLLSLGAGTTAQGWIRSFCVFTGRLSYPLYMAHIWAVWLFGNYLTAMKPGKVEMYLVAGIVFAVSVLLGYIALRFYDEPVRKWLTKAGNNSRKEKVPAVESLSAQK
jgi:peptidoglycan/LPS O-acetylase OafA/YrhL